MAKKTVPVSVTFDKDLFKRSVLYNIKTLYRKTLEEAIQILSGMGKQWMVVQGNNTSVEPGQIFRTDPPAGTQLSKNSSDTILLYVAVEQPETTQPEEEPEEEEDEGVEVLSQKSSDRKVIKKKSTE